MDKSYRIHTKTNIDSVITIPLKKDVSCFDILSMKLNVADTYNIPSANYGVVVGRVLGNEAFGIPNVKVSLFVPISDEDADNIDITSLYDFSSVTDTDENNKRYNVLQNSGSNGRDECYSSVGTLPIKRAVLDNNDEIEIFDKYWKYTTITNNSGDYMFFAVPTGTTQLHIDCDLSDIGILSQHPSDFIRNGYSPDLFDSPSKFKTEGDLDTLVQILSQNQSIYVYPFWGDKDGGKIGITRADISLNYTFTPTCVFMGSVITDANGNYYATDGEPIGNIGNQDSVTSVQGRIEMIRKTELGAIEEYKINDNSLIDENGVFCYEIPMNLDRIGTDEYGNITKINGHGKGIPTRARVRFRISLPSKENNSQSHSAKFMIPNNPPLAEETNPKLKDNNTLSTYYEFGSKTPDECFRNLYWDKVYSIKSYIPRVTKGANGGEISNNYTHVGMPIGYSTPFCCLKDSYISPTMNSFPYNSLYLASETVNTDESYNWLIDYIMIPNTEFLGIPYRTTEDIYPRMGMHFTFENDWINGCAYLPLFSITNDGLGENDVFFDVDGINISEESTKDIYLYSRQNYILMNGNFTIGDNFQFMELKLGKGVIKRVKNSKQEYIYYYAFGAENTNSQYIRLYSSDIILLGNRYDRMDKLPQLFNNLPMTSALFPPVMTDPYTDTAGMFWGGVGGNKNADNFQDSNKGLFFYYQTSGVRNTIRFSVRGQVNASRLSELDTENSVSKYDTNHVRISYPDGFIWRNTISTNENRSAFASMNYDISAYDVDSNLGIEKFKPHFMYLIDFEGRFIYTSLTRPVVFNPSYGLEGPIVDEFEGEHPDSSYIDFRYGGKIKYYKATYKRQNAKEGFERDTEYNSHGIFPLFNNSLYFYFGLYPNNNALTRLYSEFYSMCSITDVDNKSIKLTSSNASVCSEENGGSITVDTSALIKPFSYSLITGTNAVISHKENVTDDSVSINSLANASYEFNVEDYNGNTDYITFSLRYQTAYPIYTVKEFGKKVGDDEILTSTDDNSGNIVFTEFFVNGQNLKIMAWDENSFTCGSKIIRYKYSISNKEYVTGSYYDSASQNVIFTLSHPSSIIFSFWEDGCDSTTVEISVPNGKEFEGYINGIPMSHLILNNLKEDSWSNVYDTANYNLSGSVTEQLSDISAMCKMAYITIEGSTIKFSVVGGKKAIKISSYSPDYYKMDKYYEDAKGYKYVPNYTPNFVFGNYTVLSSTTFNTSQVYNSKEFYNMTIYADLNYYTACDTGITKSWEIYSNYSDNLSKIRLNPYLQSLQLTDASGQRTSGTKYENSFAAFDSAGRQIPSGAVSGNNDTYLNVNTIDKRMDFDVFARTPIYNALDGKLNAKIMNGIAMSYDSQSVSHNIWGYEYGEDSSGNLSYISSNPKKYYEITINGNDVTDSYVSEGSVIFPLINISDYSLKKNTTGITIQATSCSYDFVTGKTDNDKIYVQTEPGNSNEIDISYSSPLRPYHYNSDISSHISNILSDQSNGFSFYFKSNNSTGATSGISGTVLYNYDEHIIIGSEGIGEYEYTKNPYFRLGSPVSFTDADDLSFSNWTKMTRVSNGNGIVNYDDGSNGNKALPYPVYQTESYDYTKTIVNKYKYVYNGYTSSDSSEANTSNQYSTGSLSTNEKYITFASDTIYHDEPLSSNTLNNQIRVVNMSECYFIGNMSLELNGSYSISVSLENADYFDLSNTEFAVSYYYPSSVSTSTIFPVIDSNSGGTKSFTVSLSSSVYFDKDGKSEDIKTILWMRYRGNMMYAIPFLWNAGNMTILRTDIK